MEKLLEAAVSQSPSLVVLVVVVWMFLKHVREQREGFNREMRLLHEDHLDAREQTRKALSEQTTASQELVKVLASFAEAIKRYERNHDSRS